MALLFMDGFDCYSSADGAGKGGWIYDTGNQGFSTTNGRFGGGCLTNTVANGGWSLPVGLTQGTTFILAFAYYLESMAGGGAADVIVQGKDTAGNTLWRLDQNTAGDLKAYNQPGTQIGSTASAALTDAAWNWIEIKIKLGTDNTTGEMEVRVGGSVVISNVTGIDTYFSGNPMHFIEFRGSAGDVRIDDVILMDTTGTYNTTYLGDCKIDTMVPNSDGSTSDWTASTGSPYQCVDDTPNAANDDTDYIYTTTASQKAQLQMGNFTDNPTAVYAMQPRIRAKKSDAGDRTFRANVKSGGTTDTGTTLGLSVGYYWMRGGIREYDPDASGVWTKGTINAVQIELELVS